MKNWAENFYTKQNQWLGIYLGPVEPFHHDRAQLVHQYLDTPSPVLELGAGGGQTAIALASLGHQLTTVELLADSAQHCRNLAREYQLDLQIHQADFYQIDLPTHSYKAICYFDSFGIGSDEDQRTLLRRIAQWLHPDGFALIEIGAPWFWSGPARGQSMDLGDCQRTYDFDPDGCRLLDYWHLHESPEDRVHQSLRCYSPADLRLLLQGTGLLLQHIQPGGKVDYDKLSFQADNVPLADCMTYYAYLRPDC